MIKKLFAKVIGASALLFSGWSYSAAADVVVVVHPSNPAQIDSKTIVDLFLGDKKSFGDGTTAKLYFVKGETGEELTSKLLDRSFTQFKGYWAKRAFSGKGKPPKYYADNNDVKALVAENPNAIGVLDASFADDSVKVVLAQ
ncbi:phosphate ABC transporter substrate-binding protein [Thalassotalea montiporae]